MWAKFSPEDSLVSKRDPCIRGNRAILVTQEVEQMIATALKEFKTQEEIISYILNVRKERKFEENNNYIEIYLEVEPRPRFDYDPYKELILEINKRLQIG